MKYQVQENCLTVFLPEELDHHNTEEIREKTDRLIEEHQIKCVIFDFADTNFMDSSGIGMVLGRYKLIQKRGGNVGVASLKPTVRKIFKMSGIFKILEEYPSVDVALENMKVRV